MITEWKMHQIYSCSDENLEVFTTVISSKCEYIRTNRTKSGLHLIEQISLNSVAAYFSNKKKAGKSRENKLWGQIRSLLASCKPALSAA
uniref:Vexin n=1 Tax=Meleagris gallopavo TaxID=9103 RepID=A0A803XTP1_MELGA